MSSCPALGAAKVERRWRGDKRHRHTMPCLLKSGGRKNLTLPYDLLEVMGLSFMIESWFLQLRYLQWFIRFSNWYTRDVLRVQKCLGSQLNSGDSCPFETRSTGRKNNLNNRYDNDHVFDLSTESSRTRRIRQLQKMTSSASHTASPGNGRCYGNANKQTKTNLISQLILLRCCVTLVGKGTTFNVVCHFQNEANYKRNFCFWMAGVLLVVLKWSNRLAGWQFTCIFVVKTLTLWLFY